MYCKWCGAEVQNTDIYCSKCGGKVEDYKPSGDWRNGKRFKVGVIVIGVLLIVFVIAATFGVAGNGWRIAVNQFF
ncbi:hypothetical protein B5F07_08660 [Lachnoclostridium sp. An169]|uniref:zinc-ribbon domain-containing protein n=1 Tax=Lachnoclostridium sp. An169 TaxID=1965569 RepID=UPI000B3827A0|nr:zinc ribbon domain-containing protein [Lachnoclostridium sp. An169]OUP84197.1 hypothetical protein B5F07_08660 [Lachnoclostridium sp. An169]